MRNIPVAHLVHGSSATAWLVIPVVQAWLISHGKVKLHRTLGRFSLLLAPVVVLSGLHVVQIMVLRNLDEFRLYRIKFVFLDLTVLLLFSTFLALAIWSARKHDIGSHKRFMAGTALLALEPALERLLKTLFPTMIATFDDALYAALVSMELIIAGLIVVEWRSGRVRAIFPFLLAYFVAIHILATPVASNSSFQRFAMWFAKL